MTENPQEEHELSVVASGYDLMCACGQDEEAVQLTSLALSEEGFWIWECPGCHHIFAFDEADVGHAFG